MLRSVLLGVSLAATILLLGCDSSPPESGPGPGPSGEVKTFSSGQTATPIEPPKSP